MRNLIILSLIPLSAACSTVQTAGVAEVLSAQLVRGDGSAAGVATISRRSDGIWLSIAADAPVAGSFGMHLHAVGKCEGPDFTSAGPHWNPSGRQHGHDNPMGSHSGDLPNAQAGADLKIAVNQQIPEMLLAGDSGLVDGDGAAIIIHEKADDYKTDPSGNSGRRIICGVFKKS
ncbi:MAG: superoxide dismutase family protein [Sphingorhabdus sp.]